MDGRERERLLGGRGAVGEAADARLEAALAGIRDAFTETPVPPEMRAAHLAAIAAAVQQPGAARAPSRAWRRTGRRRVLTRSARVALLAAALSLAFSGLALAGSLPAPLQHAVSRAGTALGLHLPDGGSPESVTPSSEAPSPSSAPSVAPSSQSPAATHPTRATPKVKPSATSPVHSGHVNGQAGNADEDAQGDTPASGDQQDTTGDETGGEQQSNDGTTGDGQGQTQDQSQDQDQGSEN